MILLDSSYDFGENDVFFVGLELVCRKYGYMRFLRPGGPNAVLAIIHRACETISSFRVKYCTVEKVLLISVFLRVFCKY